MESKRSRISLGIFCQLERVMRTLVYSAGYRPNNPLRAENMVGLKTTVPPITICRNSEPSFETPREEVTRALCRMNFKRLGYQPC